MSKFKKISDLRELTRLHILCDDCGTVPLEFQAYIRTPWYQPTKAMYCCESCGEKKEVHYSKPNYFNRFSLVIVNPFVPQFQ